MWYFPIQNTLPSDCLSFFISWTKSFGAVSQTIRILWRRTQLETRSFFTKSNWKWVIILAADTKCPRMALKYITPKKPRGSGLSVARYITFYMQEGANYSLCNLFCWRFHYQSYLFMFQREEAIRKNHIVTTGGEGVADTWKVERPKSLDLLQDTSYFRAKTMVCLNCHLCLACLRESWCIWTTI